MLETFDWQWKGGDIRNEHPEYDLLPSEYFRRQIYGSFWFERASALSAIELYPDNIMFETDFPHPTSMSPGPATSAIRPDLYIEQAFAVVSEIASSIQAITANARDTERYAASTLEASGHLSSQSEQLAQHVRDYLGQVRKDLVQQAA